MILVELYSRDDCHLCEAAKSILLDVRKEQPFEFREIKIREGDREFERFRERIPVVYINKKFAFQYCVPEKELLERLQTATSSAL
jgi:glutaredoxin